MEEGCWPGSLVKSRHSPPSHPTPFLTTSPALDLGRYRTKRVLQVFHSWALREESPLDPAHASSPATPPPQPCTHMLTGAHSTPCSLGPDSFRGRKRIVSFWVRPEAPLLGTHQGRGERGSEEGQAGDPELHQLSPSLAPWNPAPTLQMLQEKEKLHF